MMESKRKNYPEKLNDLIDAVKGKITAACPQVIFIIAWLDLCHKWILDISILSRILFSIA